MSRYDHKIETSLEGIELGSTVNAKRIPFHGQRISMKPKKSSIFISKPLLVDRRWILLGFTVQILYDGLISTFHSNPQSVTLRPRRWWSYVGLSLFLISDVITDFFLHHHLNSGGLGREWEKLQDEQKPNTLPRKELWIDFKIYYKLAWQVSDGLDNKRYSTKYCRDQGIPFPLHFPKENQAQRLWTASRPSHVINLEITRSLHGNLTQ